MDVKIRKSTADDWQTIQRLNAEVYENSYQFDSYLIPNDPYSKSSEDDYKNTVTDPEKFCMISEINDEPVGYLVGGENNLSWRTNRRGEIFHMGVSPKFRSHGIGALLVRKFKNWCLEKGITHLAATTYFSDAKARNFYEKQGMIPIDVSLEGIIEKE